VVAEFGQEEAAVAPVIRRVSRHKHARIIHSATPTLIQKDMVVMERTQVTKLAITAEVVAL
jgi:hypothetical protein